MYLKNLVLVAIVPAVTGHGTMSFPPTRNTVQSHSCPQCANGQGVCGAGGGWAGDQTASAQLDSSYTTPLTTLYAGGQVEIEVYFTAPHKGHFALELCAHPGATITEDCFVRLDRDTSDNRMGPVVPAKPWLFALPENSCQSACSASAPLKARFQIPNDVSDHAVLRWYWQSGNSCDSAPEVGVNASPEVRSWSGSINGRSCSAAIGTVGIACGGDCPSLSCNGEQFRTCADVKIVGGSPGTLVTSSGTSGGSNGSGSSDGSNNSPGNGSGDSNNPGSSGSTDCNCSPDALTECKANIQPVTNDPSYVSYCAGVCDYVAYYASSMCASYPSVSQCGAANSQGYCTAKQCQCSGGSNSGSGNGDNGNSGSGNGDYGNSGSGNGDYGNSGSGNGDNGNSGSGNGDYGNSGSGNGDYGNSNGGNNSSGAGDWNSRTCKSSIHPTSPMYQTYCDGLCAFYSSDYGKQQCGSAAGLVDCVRANSSGICN